MRTGRFSSVNIPRYHSSAHLIWNTFVANSLNVFLVMQCRNKFLLHNPIATINKVLFGVDLKMPTRLFKHHFCSEDCFLEREKSLNLFQFLKKATRLVSYNSPKQWSWDGCSLFLDKGDVFIGLPDPGACTCYYCTALPAFLQPLNRRFLLVWLVGWLVFTWTQTFSILFSCTVQVCSFAPLIVHGGSKTGQKLYWVRKKEKAH